jgi:hypothetical protein
VKGFGFYDPSGYGMPTWIDDLIPPGEEYDLIVPELHLNSVEGSIKSIESMLGTICGVAQGELRYGHVTAEV